VSCRVVSWPLREYLGTFLSHSFKNHGELKFGSNIVKQNQEWIGGRLGPDSDWLWSRHA
jgi:hypothetical protein